MSNLPAAFAASLLSDRPHPAIPAEQQIFAPFIGSWDLTSDIQANSFSWRN